VLSFKVFSVQEEHVIRSRVVGPEALARMLLSVLWRVLDFTAATAIEHSI